MAHTRNMTAFAPTVVGNVAFVGALIGALIGALAGCAGSGEGLDQNGNPVSDNSGPAPLTADFKSIQDNILTPSCTQCHSGATAPRGLRLDAPNSYAMLVGVNSAEVPALKRVQPGSPDVSYLLQKIQGTAAVGGRMPLNGPPYLSNEQIGAIRQWISNGAPQPLSAKPAADTPLSVLFTAPAEAETVASPTQLLISFDRELDSSLVSDATIVLKRVHTDLAVPIRMTVVAENPSTLLLVPKEALVVGHYELVLRGTGGVALAGLDAKPLNSDSESGHDYNLTFIVGTP